VHHPTLDLQELSIVHMVLQPSNTRPKHSSSVVLFFFLSTILVFSFFLIHPI
jgi:hypothetical protein